MDYSKCDLFSDKEFCYGVYEFDSSLGKQQITDTRKFTKENISKEMIIKYNEDKPSEYFIVSDGNSSLVIFITSLGGIILIIFSIGKITLSIGKYSITKY